MKRLPLQVFALVLGFLVAFGMSVSAVHASNMAVKMVAAADVGASGKGDCDGCNDGGGDGANALACPAACMAPVVAVLPPASSVSPCPEAKLPLRPHPLLLGWASSPDPYPPRSTDLG